VLSSVGVRSGESSMAKLVATALRDVLKCDAAVINSGAIRGNRQYTQDLSYGDLKRECPFPSPIVVTQMPFTVLQEAVRESRRPWWDLAEGQEPAEVASSLQVDNGIRTSTNHMLLTIADARPDTSSGKLYSVACDTRVLGKNPVLRQYCEKFPERIPPADAGRPVLPLLAEFFCGQLWERLIKTTNKDESPAGMVVATRSKRRTVTAAFNALDLDKNGRIDEGDLKESIERCLGKTCSSKIVVEQMISMLDKDNDGGITKEELRQGMTKIISGHFPTVISL